MYEIPRGNILLNAPNNVVHGFFAYPGLPNAGDVEHQFTVPDGVYTLWCTLIGAGNGAGVAGNQDTYIGPSSNPFFKSPAQAQGTVAGATAQGQFSTLGVNGQSGYVNATQTAVGRGGSTPLGQGGDDVNNNATGYGAGGCQTGPPSSGFGAGAWFWRVPLIVTPGMIIPYFASPTPPSNTVKGAPGYISFAW